MRYPNFSEENRLWRKGFKRIAGLDEAGRGPLGGPVFAAAVIVKKDRKLKFLKVNDSKKLSLKKREELYEILINHPKIEWGIARVSEKVIDRINILEAKTKDRRKIDFLILDGNFKINSSIPQKSIIKADNKVFSCAAASILAKVSRDRMMQRYDKKYPEYGFSKHKGYATKLHFKMLRKYGPCKIHRKTFRPVSNLLSKKI
jgi:ribonuclease HII